MYASLSDCRLFITRSLILTKNRKLKSLSISSWLTPFILLACPLFPQEGFASVDFNFKNGLHNLRFIFKINCLIFQIQCKQQLLAKSPNAKQVIYGAHNHGVGSLYALDGWGWWSNCAQWYGLKKDVSPNMNRLFYFLLKYSMDELRKTTKYYSPPINRVAFLFFW